MKTTTTKFIYTPTMVDVYKAQEGQIQPKLLPEIYILKYHKQFGYYLERDKDKYEVPSKLYGTINNKADKIIRAYNRRTKSTGVLLTGNKGSGKSELIKLTANKMLSLGYPVITINEPYNGQDFMSYIDSLGECVVVFDEFAKTYKKDQSNDDVADPQEGLLTFFDGLLSSKRLVLLSENSLHDISSLMINRPGRIYYHFKYDKIDTDVIEEYCQSHNISSELTEEIIQAKTLANEFSFDMLKAIVEEHLDYPTLPFETLVQDLNVDLAEPIYTFKATEIKHPLIDAGILVVPEEPVIEDFDLSIDYDTYSQAIKLHISTKFLNKFDNNGDGKDFINNILNAGLPEKTILNAIEELNKQPDIRTLDESIPSFSSSNTYTLFINEDYIATKNGNKYSYIYYNIYIKGTVTSRKRSQYSRYF